VNLSNHCSPYFWSILFLFFFFFFCKMHSTVLSLGLCLRIYYFASERIYVNLSDMLCL
jgi:hypothetical protein